MGQQTDRIEWVDVCKGIGISLVVIAHVWDPGSRYIFWFHMPLFFYISGYLYKNSDASTGAYFKKKTIRLLVPYFSFLFLLSIPDYLVCINSAGCVTKSDMFKTIVSLTIKKIYGGRDLYGWFDVFWFITCLFLTQQVFHVICRFVTNRIKAWIIIITFFYIYAMMGQYFDRIRLPLFWGMNIVPMAILFFFMGHKIPLKRIVNNKVIIGSVIFFFAALLLDIKGAMLHEFKMKWEAYGYPILNVVLAVCGIIITIGLAKLFSQNKMVHLIFSELGKASLVIMFLHQTIRQLVFSRLPCISNEWIIIIGTAAVCYGIYYLLTLHYVTRKVFLGENS